MSIKTTISEIEIFFKESGIPLEPWEISKNQMIIDPEKFVRSHVSVIKANSGNKTFLPYWERILKYYNHCKS